MVHTDIVADSPSSFHNLTGSDALKRFEGDPLFTRSGRTGAACSSATELQRDTDDTEDSDEEEEDDFEDEGVDEDDVDEEDEEEDIDDEEMDDDDGDVTVGDEDDDDKIEAIFAPGV